MNTKPYCEMKSYLQSVYFYNIVESQSGGNEKSSRKSLFDEDSVTNTQGNIDELKGFCSGVFADK